MLTAAVEPSHRHDPYVECELIFLSQRRAKPDGTQTESEKSQRRYDDIVHFCSAGRARSSSSPCPYRFYDVMLRASCCLLLLRPPGAGIPLPFVPSLALLFPFRTIRDRILVGEGENPNRREQPTMKRGDVSDRTEIKISLEVSTEYLPPSF
ncbi:uncharacterized protein BO97DRAFT_212592 [Aspergillus homomorphus CBS 101889]|uniref:Uncharacterized protein n=1 Tax=Aspergillus homomorphus (strain CBS 101889) TaxID=1450537 RepID=A0A395I6K0_ASPHC|nr:hypothetical protein BO97DRAFT_212592 [Aspergillus homomorphus CBS 101889]RAL15456.1 hypothetical protein BO97DRAFT_212592 [Aspergillus homomorphus CBS 101889]